MSAQVSPFKVSVPRVLIGIWSCRLIPPTWLSMVQTSNQEADAHKSCYVCSTRLTIWCLVSMPQKYKTTSLTSDYVKSKGFTPRIWPSVGTVTLYTPGNKQTTYMNFFLEAYDSDWLLYLKIYCPVSNVVTDISSCVSSINSYKIALQSRRSLVLLLFHAW